MADIKSKLSKAVDAFTDVLTEGIDSKKSTGIYKYEDFCRYFRKMREKNPIIEKSTISVKRVNEFAGVRYPETKFLIRIVLLDKDNCPISINGNKEEILGSVIIANSIDTKLAEFMGEKTEKTVVREGDK